MANDELTAPQTFALIDELESATKLVDLGVAEMHELSLANDFFHLPLQLLAQGLERFLKVTYAMAARRETGKLPTPKEIRGRFGHDLIAITEGLLQSVEGSDEYIDRPAVRDDLEFIRADQDLRDLLVLLSEFGKHGRYQRLDAFLAPESVDDEANPYRRWEELESKIARRHPGWSDKIGDVQGARELQRMAGDQMAYLVDRFARAIARMWTLGALPEDAGQYMGLVTRFLYLRDAALGASR